jgi:protease IV
MVAHAMILLRLLGLLFDLLLLPLRWLGRRRGVPRGAWLSVTIDGAIADVVPEPRFWQIRAKKTVCLHDLAELVAIATKDARVAGIVVTIRALSAGMASVTSLRAILAAARTAGKQVCVHLPRGGGTKEVYVATVASKVIVGPRAQLAPLGFLTSSRYMRRALERAGIEPEIFACGEYKSAGETLVRDTMSAPQREQLDRLLGTFHAALVDAIAHGRGVTPEQAIALVDGAPYFGAKAIEAGLADIVAYEDELPGALGLSSGRGRPRASSRRIVDGGSYLARATRPLVRRLRPRPFIAVVPVHGAIAHTAGMFESFATDERVTRIVRRARADRRIKGVIVHVDSPGGSALASDLMHHEIAQLAREKPVVACMANVAASGGYYVAAPAHRVVCEATTVTGSIGVVAARVSVEPLLARLGVTTETVARGARAGLLSATHPLDDADRAALGRELDATYAAFVDVVASGRKMATSRVEELARGRVHSGADALEHGLVDALGGFSAAVREMRALLAPEVRDRVDVRVLRAPRRAIPPPEPPPPGEAGRRAASALLSALLPGRDGMLVALAARGERVLALGPITST